MRKYMPWLIIGGVILLIAFWMMGAQRSLVNIDENVNKTSSDLEAQYQRRLDLFDNLVATVQQYAAYEKEVMIKVTEARSSLGSFKLTPELLKDPEAMKQFQQSQNMLVGAMKSVLALQEKYPDLKANENFNKLQDEITGTENRIVIARKDYNEAVKTLNAKIRRFPVNMVAGMFGFAERPYFKAEEDADKTPKVRELFKK
ncbi:MAG: LemA family protein [Flavobacteriaceae bacterium]|nr:LemA family protein [Flavobacteriaceae bacterium]